MTPHIREHALLGPVRGRFSVCYVFSSDHHLSPSEMFRSFHDLVPRSGIRSHNTKTRVLPITLPPVTNCVLFFPSGASSFVTCSRFLPLTVSHPIALIVVLTNALHLPNGTNFWSFSCHIRSRVQNADSIKSYNTVRAAARRRKGKCGRGG